MEINVDVDISGALKKLDKEYAVRIKTLGDLFKVEVLRLEGIIKETAPVFTGRYRSAWHSKINGLEAEIANNVHYAVYLIFGTRKFRNVKQPHKYKKADISRGILHDVRAIVHEWENEFISILRKVIG